MPNPRTFQPVSALRGIASSPPSVTVWRPTLGGTDAHFGTTVAARLTATYTKPGDLLVALDHPIATAQAAIWLSRRAALIVTERHREENLARTLETRFDPTRRTAARVLYAPAADRSAPLRQAPGRAHLIVATVPESPRGGGDDSDIHRLLADCATAAHPRGLVVLEVPTVDAAGQFSDAITTVISAVRTVGLVYHEHLVAIHDRLYPPSATPVSQSRPPSPYIHASPRAHVDLLILATPGAIYV